MSESCIKTSLASRYLGLYVYEKGEKVVCHVATAGVFPEMQIKSVASSEKRKGYATELLKHILSEKKNEGIETVSLEVRVSNNAAKALYEKLGFTAVGTEKNYMISPLKTGWK